MKEHGSCEPEAVVGGGSGNAVWGPASWRCALPHNEYLAELHLASEAARGSKIKARLGPQHFASLHGFSSGIMACMQIYR